jgi:hypothetical protein
VWCRFVRTGCCCFAHGDEGRGPRRAPEHHGANAETDIIELNAQEHEQLAERLRQVLR